MNCFTAKSQKFLILACTNRTTLRLIFLISAKRYLKCCMKMKTQCEIYQLDDLSYAVHVLQPIKDGKEIQVTVKDHELFDTRVFKSHDDAIKFAQKNGEIVYCWYGHFPLRIPEAFRGIRSLKDG